MEHDLMVAQATMIAMALAGIFTVVLPLGLGIFFWKRTGGRWRFFFLGCVIFPVAAMVLESMLGIPVKLVEASYKNIKITTPEDLQMAEVFLHQENLSKKVEKI